MKLGVKEMKREYKKVNIDQIEVTFDCHLRDSSVIKRVVNVITGHAGRVGGHVRTGQ